MPCKACGSQGRAKFAAEVAVHIPGRNNHNKPHLFVFPEILVCWNCGNAEFTGPENELRALANEMRGKYKAVRDP